MNQMLSPEITMSPRAHHIITPQIILLIYCPMILSGTNISLTGLIFRDQINILCVYHLVFEYLPCNLGLLKNHFRKLRNLTVFIFIFLSHRNLTTFGQFHLISSISFINHPQILGFHWPTFLSLNILYCREYKLGLFCFFSNIYLHYLTCPRQWTDRFLVLAQIKLTRPPPPCNFPSYFPIMSFVTFSSLSSFWAVAFLTP